MLFFYLKNLNRFSLLFALSISCVTSPAQDSSWPGLDIGTVSCPSTKTQTGNTTGANQDCSNSSAGDHIYQFTTTVDADVTLSLCTGTTWDTQIWLYDLSAGNCNGTSITSNDDFCSLQSEITVNGLAAGTYVVVVEGYSTNEGAYQLDITTSNCQTPPDLPCDATPLTINCAANYSSYTNSGLTDSGEGNPFCGSYSGGDIWFSFTAPASGEATITTQSNQLSDVAMAIYAEGAMGCSSLTLLSCSDGGASMPSITENGLTAGNTYYVRVWDENNDETGLFDIAITDPTQLYCLNGNAVDYTPTGHTPSDNCVQLTDAINDQSGCAWSNSPMNLNNNFDVEFTVYLGDDDGGADGMAFVIQNTGGGAASSCGSTGGGVGAEGLTPSLIVEFDTWQNGAGESENLPWEPTYDHISVETDGTLIHDGFGNSAPACGPVQASATSADIEDGIEHDVRITWDATTYALDIYFDGNLRLSCSIDMVSILGTTYPTWGFTASTGGFNNEQYFCPGTLPLVLSVDVQNLSVTCTDRGNLLQWTLNNENTENQTFLVQKSSNGTTFTDIATVVTANSNPEWLDRSGGKTYYRLKQINQAGKEIYSPIVISNCSRNNQPVLWKDAQSIHIELGDEHEEGVLKLSDVTGRVIQTENIVEGENHYSFILQQSKGLYFLSVQTPGSLISQKFIY